MKRRKGGIRGGIRFVIYECGICGAYHPWNFAGDCRDDANRFGGPEDYAERLGVTEDKIEVRSMEERVEADNA